MIFDLIRTPIYDLIRYFGILEESKALNHRLLIVDKDTLKENAKQETFDLFPVKGKSIELQYSGEKVSTDGGLLILKEVDNLFMYSAVRYFLHIASGIYMNIVFSNHQTEQL